MTRYALALDLPLDVAAPRNARHATDAVLRAWGVADELVLAGCAVVVTELVTNAVRHTTRGGPSRVALQLDGDVLTVSVSDPSPVVPRMRSARDTETSGRGLGIVDHLSVRWGSRPDGAGKCVFAELSLALLAEHVLPVHDLTGEDVVG